jgi:hypothetical protein
MEKLRMVQYTEHLDFPHVSENEAKQFIAQLEDRFATQFENDNLVAVITGEWLSIIYACLLFILEWWSLNRPRPCFTIASGRKIASKLV